LVLILEMAVASIAVALILLSLKTLQAIRHLGVGKSFWTPVAVSGFLFFFGSVVAILFELNYSLTTYTDEVVQVSRLLALCILVGGVYSYSRKVTKNLGEKFPVPARAVKADAEAGDEAEAPVSPVVPAGPVAPPAESIPERVIQESLEKEAVQECKYRFGYLRTLPKDASIPDECFSCDKIIDCKHSQAKTLESPPPQPS
jgi:hypothetical protein